ncbi:MAG: hypothetical protein ABR567_09865 [Myxococcales bacterium]|nr:hypothetical protein [Myxococcales bacterium]
MTPAGKRLFEVPPAEFTKARDALVRELREKGKADEAKEVASLRKPSTALWIANQLARIAPGDVKALIHATERLRKGDDLREAMHEQREALTRLSDAAGRAALEAGTQFSLALQRRVQNTVQAAATTAAGALREGALESELEPVGFEGLAGVPMPAPKRAREKEEPKKENQQELRKAERAAKKLGAQAQKLERAAAKAEAVATKAREKAGKARSEADAAAARALELRRG